MTSATLPILSWPITDKIKLAALGLLGIWIALMANITIIMKGPVQPDTGSETPTDVRAFPSCEGFACNTLGGRKSGSTLCIVTNTNSSGTGSFLSCLQSTSPRFVIFKVSGIITLSEPHVLEQHSNFHIFGQTAPGDGIMITATAGNRAIRFGNDNGSTAPHDMVIQHIRFRLFPGQGSGPFDGDDAIIVTQGTNNLVLDHIEAIWASDEQWGLYTAGGSDTWDITFSRSIIGEGGGAQNYASLNSGKPGNDHYNITWHHNLVIHTNGRAPKWNGSTGSPAQNRGIELINNVYYNARSRQVFLQSGTQFFSSSDNIKMDVIGNYFKTGQGGRVNPVYLNHTDPENCTTWSSATFNLKMEGNTWRNVSGSSEPGNDEADNYNMIAQTSPAECGWTERANRVTQPTHPVTVQTYTDAYSSIVIDEDVGAFPHDSHAQRLVDAPENGDSYNESLIPPPTGSGSVSFTTYNAPTDSDNDGLPDTYETTIGTNPNVFENHAVIDTDGDGYVNVEDWAHSLSPYAKYRTVGN